MLIDPTNKTITMPMGEYNSMQLRMEQLDATIDEYEKEVPLLIVHDEGPYNMYNEHKVYRDFTAQNLTNIEPVLDEYMHCYLSKASEAKERVEDLTSKAEKLGKLTERADVRLKQAYAEETRLTGLLYDQREELKTALPLWLKTIAAVLYTLAVIKFMQG